MMSKEAKRGGLPNSKKLELVRFGACTPSVAQIPIFRPLPGRLGPAIFAGAFGVCWRYPAHMGRHGGDDLHRIQIPAEGAGQAHPRPETARLDLRQDREIRRDERQRGEREPGPYPGRDAPDGRHAEQALLPGSNALTRANTGFSYCDPGKSAQSQPPITLRYRGFGEPPRPAETRVFDNPKGK
jgi:hypothetical protein